MRLFKNNICLLALTLFFVSSCSLEPISKTPNVIFILTDDMGFSDLGSYGSKMINTPNLDLLASEGALLNSYYSSQAVVLPPELQYLLGVIQIE